MNTEPTEERDYATPPLSGRGQMISVHRDPPYRLVVWAILCLNCLMR